jgi:biotin transport system substrate-specific component
MERDLTYVALFAALIAVLGLVPAIAVLPGLSITAQSMGVMLAGTVLGARRGFLATLLFVVVMSAGLPVWASAAGPVGGLALYATPKVGFIVGFPFASFACGLVMERWRAPVGIAAFAGAVIGGMGVLYAFGIPGMAWGLGKSLREASVIALSFIPGDLIKAVLTALVTQAVARARPGALLSRA